MHIEQVDCKTEFYEEASGDVMVAAVALVTCRYFCYAVCD